MKDKRPFIWPLDSGERTSRERRDDDENRNNDDRSNSIA